MRSCTDSLPAFEGFLYYASLRQNEISYCYYFFNLRLREAVSGISGIFQQEGRQAGGVSEARTAFSTLRLLLLDFPTFSKSSFFSTIFKSHIDMTVIKLNVRRSKTVASNQVSDFLMC